MKKTIVLAVLLAFGMSVRAQFNINEFETSPLGFKYKIERSHPAGKQVKEGDLIIGRFSIYFGDTIIYDGMSGNIEPAIPVIKRNNLFKGDLVDAVKIMKEKEIMTFAFPSDTMKKYPTGIPQELKAKYVYYTVEIDSLVDFEEFDRQQKAYAEMMQKQADSLKAEEQNLIKAFLQDNKWDVTLQDGIYFKMIEQGDGDYPQTGNTAFVNYTGQFLDGRAFDSSIEEDAKTYNIYNEQRKYEPIKFKVGRGQMIKGFEAATLKLRKGGKAVVLLPSDMAYGDRGVGEIRPFTPLIFTIELVDIIK